MSYLVVLKLDMNKAYDRVSWLYILKILQAYGFPASWVHLIHPCIFIVYNKILIRMESFIKFSPNIIYQI